MASGEEQQPPQELQRDGLPEHLQRTWREAGGSSDLEVKNTFITVSDPADLDARPLARSNSWSGFSSTSHSDSGSGCMDGSSEILDSTSGSDSIPLTDMKLVDAPRYAWSVGSKGHEVGQCNPCMYLASASGCARGEECIFCHLAHDTSPKRTRCRPCKATRSRCKSILEELSEKYKDDPDEKQQAMVQLMGKHPYMRGLLLGALQSDRQGYERDGVETEAQQPARAAGLQQRHDSAAGSSQPATSSGGPGETTGLGSLNGKSRKNLVSL
eukprot:TRINITY_DN26811_c0_g1_i1.p1 TRINITY_DN26811_c0_g1~~TRINITY_DN26811_c0_g1_i1.p1  ORF type:complete len:270 (-),score=41.89 TRINITY_DN26811_c0_g1_i1:33-842(-)